MTEKKLEKMLNQADFSQMTDLKQRLRAQLFGQKVVKFPTRQALEDDDLAELFAAGEADARKTTLPKDLLK